jgi:hypothetical protein
MQSGRINPQRLKIKEVKRLPLGLDEHMLQLCVWFVLCGVCVVCVCSYKIEIYRDGVSGQGAGSMGLPLGLHECLHEASARRSWLDANGCERFVGRIDEYVYLGGCREVYI